MRRRGKRWVRCSKSTAPTPSRRRRTTATSSSRARCSARTSRASTSAAWT
nr:MAG TPA: hypothetical protein [Caudoviricetes sp.]